MKTWIKLLMVVIIIILLGILVIEVQNTQEVKSARATALFAEE